MGKYPNLEEQGQTVHMLQFFGVYIPLARLYIYTYIFTCSTPKFFTTFSLRILGRKKPYNMDCFNKFKTKIFIFRYFQKIPYVKFYFTRRGGGVPGGPRTLKKIMISKNYFN